MPSEYCPHCKVNRNVRVDVYRRQKTEPDGDAIKIETKTLYCEICDLFVNSEDTIVSGVRHSKINRRSEPISADGEHAYKGPDRRSGNERRIWVDKLSETRSKM